VFILKIVKVLCFVTVLQVLILKEVMGAVCLQESNWVGHEHSEGVRRTTWRAPIVRRALSYARSTASRRRKRADLTKPLYHIGTVCQ
jgi:hypothetical protein